MMEIVKYKLLDYFKFDNEIINVLLMIFIPILFTHITTITLKAREMFLKKKKSTSVRISTCIRNSHNLMFDVVCWFISNQEIKNEGSIVTVNSYNRKMNIVIGRNIKTRVIIPEQFGENAGKEIYITNVYSVDNNKVEEYFIIEYYGNNCILKSILNKIKELYFKEKTLKKWEPKINYIEEKKWRKYDMENYTTFDTLIMNEDIRMEFKNDVSKFIKSEEEYKKKGLTWSRGYLLHGVPGCGKSSLIKAISNFTKMNLFSFDLNSVKNDDQLRFLFREIPKNSIIMFEDIDCLSDIITERTNESKHDEKSFTLSGLLNELDGIGNSHGMIKIMTTNFKEKLDSALIRPGRMDFMFELKRASKEQIIQTIKLHSDIDTSNIHESYIDKYTVANICNMVNKGCDFSKKQ
jgi:ATP-dependent Zn protease